MKKYNRKLTEFEEQMLAQVTCIDVSEANEIMTAHFFGITRHRYPEIFEKVYIEYLRNRHGLPDRGGLK